MLSHGRGKAACANFSLTGRLLQERFLDNHGGFEESEEQPEVCCKVTALV